jgi:hypothetical protein
MPAPSSALRSNSVEGYAMKDDLVNPSGEGCESLCAGCRKSEIEKLKGAAVPTVV